MIFLFLITARLLLGVCGAELFPYGPHLDVSLPTEDDASSNAIPLNTPFIFFGDVYKKIWINTNGQISFLQPMTDFTEETGPIPTPYLSAFWDDIDIRNGGVIYYRLERDPDELDMMAEEILHHGGYLKPKLIVIITWLNVRQYDVNLSQENTFQVVLATDGHKSYTIFNYDQMQWAHRGVAAFNKGGDSGMIVNVPGSGDPEQVLALTSYSNVCNPGRVVVRTDPGLVDFLHCCSMTSGGLVRGFHGKMTQITPEIAEQYKENKVSVAKALNTSCVFNAKTAVYELANNMGMAHAYMEIHVIKHNKKTFSRIYRLMTKVNQVVEKGPGSKKGVVKIPKYSPKNRSNIAVRGNLSAWFITSKKCPYMFYYGPLSPEPVFKVIIGDDLLRTGITGVCSN